MSNIPNGRYKAKACGPAQLIESNKGTPGISVELELTLPEGVLERLSWTGWLTDGTLDRTLEALRTMGWKGDDISKVDGLDQEVSATVKAEEYQGNWYPRIAYINKPGTGAMGADMTADKAKAFSAALRDRIKAFDAAGGKAPKKTLGGVQAPEPPPQGDFDVPF